MEADVQLNHDDTLQLAKKVNELQAKFKDEPIPHPVHQDLTISPIPWYNCTIKLVIYGHLLVPIITLVVNDKWSQNTGSF